MSITKIEILSGLAIAGSSAAALLGGWDTALQALCIVMALDYLTGIACALIWKKSPKSETGAFESNASIKGLLRKGLMLAVVWVACNVDILLGTTFLRDAVVVFFIGNDGLSIVENLGVMGVPLPAVVKNAFEILKKSGEKKNDENGPA